ncbi:MAG: LptA/OstA family protein [Caulobacteraceae bacterium]
MKLPRARTKGAATAAAAFAIFCGLSVAAGAMAQQGGAGGLSKSSSPIDISADQGETISAENRATFRGNVEVKQDDGRLRTPVLDIFYVKGTGAPADPAAPAGTGGQKIERMEAEGPVFYITPTQTARGDHGTYIAATDTITLTGNVVVAQDKNVLQGEKLVIETKTGRSTMMSSAQGRNASGRVRGVFYPNSSAPASPAATPAAGGRGATAPAKRP